MSTCIVICHRLPQVTEAAGYPASAYMLASALGSVEVCGAPLRDDVADRGRSRRPLVKSAHWMGTSAARLRKPQLSLGFLAGTLTQGCLERPRSRCIRRSVQQRRLYLLAIGGGSCSCSRNRANSHTDFVRQRDILIPPRWISAAPRDALGRCAARLRQARPSE